PLRMPALSTCAGSLELLELNPQRYWNFSPLRLQDSNLVLTAPKAVVLPLHQGGSRPELWGTPPSLAARNDNGRMPASDEVDRIVDAWARERPDIDFAPLQVLSRVDRLAKHLDRARRSAFTASGLEAWE